MTKMIFGVAKRVGAAALAVLTAVSIAACKTQQEQSGNNTEHASQSSDAPAVPITGSNTVKVTPDPNATQAPIHDLDLYSCQFIRIPYSETANSMTPYVVKSAEDLRKTLNEALNDNASGSARSSETVEDYMKDYSEDFFKSHYILVFNLTFSSGSVVPNVKSVKMDNGVVTVETEGIMNGDVGTADMASHMCLLSLDAERYPETSSFKLTGSGTALSTDTKRR